MFDSGFLELMVVAVIALLVVGPERLPGIARKVGAFIGKARAFINTTKADIEKELQASEMKSMLSRQEKEISELRDMMQDAKKTIEHEVEEIDENLDKSLTDAASAIPTKPITDTAEKAALINDNNDSKKS